MSLRILARIDVTDIFWRVLGKPMKKKSPMPPKTLDVRLAVVPNRPQLGEYLELMLSLRFQLTLTAVQDRHHLARLPPRLLPLESASPRSRP